MMKPRFTKHLCMLLTLLLLLAPAAALAEGTDESDAAIRIGNQPSNYTIVKKGELDTGGDLFLNGIPYQAQLNPEGDIVVRNADLTAAAKAADAIAVYEAQNPGEKFDETDNMNIISGYGLKVQHSELPDMKTAVKEIEAMQFPPDNVDSAINRLQKALTRLNTQFFMNNYAAFESYGEISDTIDLLNQYSSERFCEFLTEFYQLLFDIRSMIARGEISSDVLTDKYMTDVRMTFRNILEQGGINPKELEFWELDKAWVAYAAKESDAKLKPGTSFTINDAQGNDLRLNVSRIWNAPVVAPPIEHEADTGQTETYSGGGTGAQPESGQLDIESEEVEKAALRHST